MINWPEKWQVSGPAARSVAAASGEAITLIPCCWCGLPHYPGRECPAVERIERYEDGSVKLV